MTDTPEPSFSQICKECGRLDYHHENITEHEFSAMPIPVIETPSLNLVGEENFKRYSEFALKKTLEMSPSEIMDQLEKIEKTRQTLNAMKYGYSMALNSLRRDLTPAYRKEIDKRQRNLRNLSDASGAAKADKIKKNAKEKWATRKALEVPNICKALAMDPNDEAELAEAEKIWLSKNPEPSIQ